MLAACLVVVSGSEAAFASSQKSSRAKEKRYHSLSTEMAAKMRNPASTAYPDGITGPHSDLFRKVRSRYASENLDKTVDQ